MNVCLQLFQGKQGQGTQYVPLNFKNWVNLNPERRWLGNHQL